MPALMSCFRCDCTADATPGAQALAADFQAGAEAYSGGDYAAALREFRPLAERGGAAAQYFLGVMYANGQGVPQDTAEAVTWFRKAADQGFAAAQYFLGVLYAGGEGVPQDAAEAVRWFRQAAEQGYVFAQYNLGVHYASGEGVPQDRVQAYAWVSIATDQGHPMQGHPIGDVTRASLAESMSRDDISRAQELAREYWEAYVEPFR